MRRRLLAIAGLAAVAVGPAATAAPADSVAGESIQSSSAGLLACVAGKDYPRRWLGCIVAYRMPDQQVAVRVLAPGKAIPGTTLLHGTYTEEAVLPASALSVGGDASFPVVRVTIPAGVLPRTGAVELRATAAFTPTQEVDSLSCVGQVPGPLNYALVSDSASRSAADVNLTGTWGGVPAAIDDLRDSCLNIHGSLFTEPMTGAWWWADPLNDSNW